MMKKRMKSIIGVITALCILFCGAVGVSAANRGDDIGVAPPVKSERGVKLAVVPTASDGPRLIFKGDGKLYITASGAESEYTGQAGKWTAEGNTLTLNGFSYETAGAVVLTCTEDTNLVIEGENILTSKFQGSDVSVGIEAQKNLAISGAGVLKLTAGTAAGKPEDKNSSIGLACVEELSIGGTSTVYAGGGESAYWSCGIQSSKLTVNDSAVVEGSSVGTSQNGGIYVNYAEETVGGETVYSDGTLTVNGGVVKGAGSETNLNSRSYGIICAADITINGGEVTGDGGKTAAGQSLGITLLQKGDFIINGGRVCANGGDTVDSGSYGLAVYGGDLIVNSGLVNIAAGNATYSKAENDQSGGSFGIYCANDDFNIYGGKITVSGGNSSRFSDAVCVNEGKINVYGGEVRATAGTSDDRRLAEADYASAGVFAKSGVMVDGGTVIAKASKAYYSYAVESYGAIQAKAGVLKAVTGEGAKYAAAVISFSAAENMIAVEDGLKISIGPDYEQRGFANMDEANKITVIVTAASGGSTATDARIGIDMPFTDINKKAYYDTPLLWANGSGIISGETKTTFAPNATITREMLMAMLYRLAGKPDVSGTNFPDVAETSYAYNAILWAKNEGIAAGIDGLFYGGEPVTREQTASFIYRYGDKIAHLDMSETASLRAFADHAAVHEYARTPIGWCVAKDILSGSEGNILPQNQATRAEVTAMVYRLHLQISADK